MPETAPSDEPQAGLPQAVPTCRHCHAPLSVMLADLGATPVANDYLTPPRRHDPEPYSPLKAYVCSDCRLVQLQDFHRSEDLFRTDYAYFSSVSTTWLAHAAHYARRMARFLELGATSQVIEVASNDGYLLQYFKEKGIPVLGIEPCRSVAQFAIHQKGIPTRIEFFGRAMAERLVAEGLAADLVVANNVLAHVPDINDFVSGFATLLKPEGVATFEFHHLLALIQLNAFDTIYHEHFSYLSLLAAERIFAANGLRVFDVEQLATHGGSLRLFVCRPESARKRTARVDEVLDMERAAGLHTDVPYVAFAERVREAKWALLELLIDLKRHGKSVVAYGAAAKGNTLLNYCGVGADMLDYVVDRSPHKQGMHLPGTRLEIRPPEAIDQSKPDYILILPWNLQEEVMAEFAHVAQWGGRFIVPIPKARVVEIAAPDTMAVRPDSPVFIRADPSSISPALRVADQPVEVEPLGDAPQQVPSSPRAIDHNWLGLGASYALPLIAGAAAGIALVYLMVRPQWGDQTWLLFAARRIMEMGRFGFEDLVETNPPLIVWLFSLPVALGRSLGISLQAALQGCLAVLAVATIAWSTILMRRLTGARFAGWFVPILLFATVIHPWEHYGQREHIMLFLVLPYLIMVAGRMEGVSPSISGGLVAGLLAALGFLLKPHHLLVVLAVEGVLLARTREPRMMVRPEAVAMVATGLAYVGAILLWAPDYLFRILPLLLRTYYDYHRVELSELILPMRGLKMALIVLLWAALYRWLVHRGLATVLLLAAIGTTVGHVAQMKAHEYHLVPALAFFGLLFGVMAIDCGLRWAAPRMRPIAIRTAAAGAVSTFTVAAMLCYPLQLARAGHGYTDGRIAVQRAMSHEIPIGATVVILSTSAEAVFEQVLDRGWEWGSRFLCLWMLPAIVNAERAAERAGIAVPAAMRNAALMIRDAVLADLVRWHPNPVLIDRCQDDSIAPCMGSGQLRLNLLRWFEQDPRFAGLWADYVREGEAGPYDLWCRKGETEICHHILADLQASVSSSSSYR